MPEDFNAPGIAGATGTGQMLPPTPGGDPSRVWVPTAQTARALVSTRGALRALATQTNNIKRPLTPLDVFHPFKIYQVPSVLRFAPDPATDWLKVRVRSGLVVIDDFDGVMVDGTDGADLPDTEDYPDVDDIEVPAATPKFYFWADISNTAAPFLGYDTTAPALDGTIVPIGWADSNTGAADRRLDIRQIKRDDITAPPDNCPL